jgi:hypothetical protein
MVHSHVIATTVKPGVQELHQLEADILTDREPFMHSALKQARLPTSFGRKCLVVAFHNRRNRKRIKTLIDRAVPFHCLFNKAEERASHHPVS